MTGSQSPTGVAVDINVNGERVHKACIEISNNDFHQTGIKTRRDLSFDWHSLASGLTFQKGEVEQQLF